MSKLANDAMMATEDGRQQDAIAHYTDLLGFHLWASDRIDALYNRAVARKDFFDDQGSKDRSLIDRALVDVEELFTLGPPSSNDWNFKGVLLKNLGRYTEAQMDYQHALEFDPGSPPALFDVGTMIAVVDGNSKRPRVGNDPDQIA